MMDCTRIANIVWLFFEFNLLVLLNSSLVLYLHHSQIATFPGPIPVYLSFSIFQLLTYISKDPNPNPNPNPVWDRACCSASQTHHTRRTFRTSYLK